jgi:hypothetical protein
MAGSYYPHSPHVRRTATYLFEEEANFGRGVFEGKRQIPQE